ncbi:MAG: hypothetical protein V9G20_31315 [Candidatus Promineifilaceae bacterium]
MEDILTLWGGPIIWHRTMALLARWVLGILVIWATVAYWQKKPVGKAFLVIIAASELLMIVQSTVGGYFFLGLGMRPGSWVQHLLYGGLSLFTLPTVVYSIRNEVDQRRVARIWAFTCLFMFGLTFRTATTGVMGG